MLISANFPPNPILQLVNDRVAVEDRRVHRRKIGETVDILELIQIERNYEHHKTWRIVVDALERGKPYPEGWAPPVKRLKVKLRGKCDQQ
jgi:hypothetical protein